MSDTIIKVENLGKKYTIGHQTQSGGWKPNRGNYVALRDVITNNVKSFGKQLLGKEKRASYTTEDFWALKDINFEIKRGEVVGIIGRNGAGKSTLLKILSRITEPTTGRIELRGRVASLLEVGTGFHPELTGRENIYLNGSVLGMQRNEIRKKFDEIVEFAEVEKFLDTPVKRYSSGMYVRLAFAVAAHLEPEILVVDEVLAVGDAAFQKKCLGKMEDVAKNEGRTVLFVSHNMATVQKLCNQAIFLKNGSVVKTGTCQDIINFYLSSLSENNQEILLERKRHHKELGLKAKISQCYSLNSRQEINQILEFGEPFAIVIKALSYEDIKQVTFTIRIDSILNDPIVTSTSDTQSVYLNFATQEYSIIQANFSDLLMTPGKYWITVSLRQERQGIDQVIQASTLEISETSYLKKKQFNNAWGYIQYEPNWILRQKLIRT